MKNIVYLLLIICCVNSFAQKQDVVSAIMDFKDGEFMSAKEAIDNATLKIENLNNKPLKPKRMSDYHHYKGQIYLMLFEKKWFSESDDKSHQTLDFELLEIASNAFLDDVSLEGSNSKESYIKLDRCARLYQDAGYKEYEQKAYISSEDKFSNAIRINSAINVVDSLNMFYAAVTAFLAEDYQQAVSWSSKLVKINPLDVRYHERLIDSYEELGDLDGQLIAIKNAREAIPQSKNIILKEVNYYISIRDNKLLLQSLDNAVGEDPKNPVLHFVLGSTYSNLGNLDKAKSSYITALDIDPSYVDACNNLAAIYLDEANVFIEKKNTLPINASQKQYNNLSNKIKNLREQALPYLEKVLLLQPTDNVIIETLKQIYYQLEMDQKSLEMKKLMDLPDDQKKGFVDNYFAN